MSDRNAAEMQDGGQEARRTRGRFRPGQSGNPSGSMKSKRYLALHAEIIGDLGGDEASLSGVERIIVGQVCNLLVRAERVKDADDAVRCANSASRLLATLRNGRHKREPTRVPLRERLAAEAEQAG